MLRHRLILATMVVALTACAPVTRIPSISATAIAQEQELQNNMVIGDILERQEHLLTVAWPLLRNAAWLCPHTNSGLGLLVVNDPSIPQPRWGQDKNVAGSGGLLVAAVAPGSPADNVGLRKGDTIVAIANVNLTGRTAINDYYRLTSKLPTSIPLSLRHSRANALTDTSVAAETICGYPVIGILGNSVNTYGNGAAVFINEAMIRFARSADELAIAIGHQLAHNILHQRRKSAAGISTNSLLAALLENVGGTRQSPKLEINKNKVYSPQAENEADYLGLYITAMGGYNIEGAVDFWRRTGVENHNSHAHTHTITAARFTKLQTVVSEISSKLDAGQELKPENISRR